MAPEKSSPKFDEMLDADGRPRPHYQAYARWLADAGPAKVAEWQKEADLLFRRVGITFNVYGDTSGTERLIPFDLIPRVIPSNEWKMLEKGLRQRVATLNAFLHDIYHGGEILKAGKVPADKVLRHPQYRPVMKGLDVPGGVYSHIAGVDLVRDGEGTWCVLEDNLRTPSGVSYMLEDRKVMMQLFPELFDSHRVAPVDHYPELLLNSLRETAPAGVSNPTVVLLTPGAYNSAYFEHTFLAQQMGIELVEGPDLYVQDDRVWVQTTRGPQRVDVIYRRIDDDYLDPQVFRADSVLGVPGLMQAYRAGRVTIANGVGTGVADDKSIYPYVPDMIRFYLGEEPVLANVPTWLLEKPDDLAYVLDHLPELVVKEAQGSGGYGMLIGPSSTKQEIEDYRKRILAAPADFIAQPTLSLSTCPTFVESGVAPRHIDLRPFVLSGREVRIVPGGLTRVALKEGSLVVNSSQGGGTKDTWVLQ
ncbi:MAG: circularly permuted type 2 ATP-grasp protein [Burkholderiales bacterium]